MKNGKITLQNGEYIVAAVPEYCAGPGLANTPVWVYIACPEGNLRMEAIQPDEQSREMRLLFRPAEAMHRAMKSLVPTRKVRKPKA